MIGKIGNYRARINLTIRNGSEFVTGHYFYVSHLIDIPLKGGIDGNVLTLREPTGGVFRLHLVKEGTANGQTLMFANIDSLHGVWTDNGKNLSTRFRVESKRPGSFPDQWYSQVTAQSDAQFEALVGRFKKGVVDGNRVLAADAVSYPLRVYFVYRKHMLVIRTKAELLASWDKVFTPAYIAILEQTIPHEMFIHNSQAMLGNGEVWFGPKGAIALNIIK